MLRRDRTEELQAFLSSLAKTATARQAAAEEQRLTWGDLLASRLRTTEDEEGEDRDLRIDQEELAELGLTASTPVVFPSAPVASDDDEDLAEEQWAARGAELLHTAQLALVAHAHGLLLTTRPQVALFRAEFQPGPFVACARAPARCSDPCGGAGHGPAVCLPRRLECRTERRSPALVRGAGGPPARTWRTPVGPRTRLPVPRAPGELRRRCRLGGSPARPTSPHRAGDLSAGRSCRPWVGSRS